MKFSTAVVALASAGAVQALHKPDCDAFCATAATACTAAAGSEGAFPYTDAADCKAKCALMTPGLAEAASAQDYGGPPLAGGYIGEGTDTYFCRNYHLGVAAADPMTNAVHCGHIGGAGEVATPPCGTAQCDKFCADHDATCSGEAAENKWATTAECVTACNSWLPNKRGAYGLAGNSFGCRRYHLDVAGVAGGIAGGHCGHAGPTGNGVCVDNVPNFCGLYTKACTDPATNGGAVAYGSCLADLATIPEGEPADKAGNTRTCRQYHLDVAFNTFDAAVHCKHAAKDGGGVCVEPEATTAEPAPATRSFAGVAAAVALAVALVV